MKKQVSLLAICLCVAGVASAQNTTSTYLAKSTTPATNSVYTPTDTTNSANAITSSGMMTANGTIPNSTYSTNKATTAENGTAYAPADTKKTKADGYKNFVFGIYAGLNTTKFKGEEVTTTGNNKLTGRLGYQAGFFVRGGGRLYGQIGAEYFASSSNYFTQGSGQSASDIKDQINIKYIQVPVYIGYKLVESDRGISAVRLQVGLEYANRIGSDANKFGSLNNFEVKSGTFNGLGQLGFDMGPVFIDLTYHYGFGDSITQNAGFATSQRRIASASFGFKF